MIYKQNNQASAQFAPLNIEGQIPRERIAYHEAGHAAVAHYYGWDLWECTISPSADDEAIGFTKHYNPCYPTGIQGSLRVSNKRDMERAVTVCYAGFAAEICFDPSCKERAESCAEGDFSDAFDLLRARFGISYLEEWDRTEARCMQRAHKLISQTAVWSNVRRIAEALLEKDTLTQEDFERIIL